jgi:hypothetical protein
MLAAAPPPPVPFSPRPAQVQPASVMQGHRPKNGAFEYVILDGEIDVYREGSTAVVQRIRIPALTAGTRGVAVDPPRHLLYLSYAGDGGDNGTGSLLKYDLLRDRIVWQKDYPIGIDSFGLSADGRLVFMPGGEADGAPWWYVLRASDGTAIARIDGGSGAHNTIVTKRFVYMSPRQANYLTIADAKTFKVVRRVGPLIETSRPMTVNGRETLVFTTASLHRGFQVSSTQTGKVLYTVDFGPVPSDFKPTAPSHGISLSPNEKQLWVIDAPAASVRVYDVSGLPRRAPKEIAVLPTPKMGDPEGGCAYDCLRSGWVQHTLDGRYVYVGDTGNVYATNPPRLAFTLPTLRDTRKHIEIDWRNGRPVATSTRSGIGHR